MKIVVPPEKQLEQICLGVQDIISKEELLKKLELSYEKQEPLVVKLGADPSASDIHLGHTVVINKLRIFQELGHKVVFVIGDFTAMIGDPTGKNKTRPPLTAEEVSHHAETYKAQIFKILDPQKTEVAYNSSWLNKFSPYDFIKLLATKTVQQMLAREDFSERHMNGSPIFIHEILYPLLQGYDSVALKADVELGGSDQRFNLLVGRELQKDNKQRPQSLVLMPLLEGLDGVQKMSKSLGNYIGVNDDPKDMFGKVMSISDELMIRFYELISKKTYEEIQNLKSALADGSLHPMEAKKSLAQEIVSIYWGVEIAKEELDKFEKLFSKKELPSDIAIKSIAAHTSIQMLDLLVEIGFAPSKSEARRVMRQNGIRLYQLLHAETEEKLLSQEQMSFNAGEYILRYGKLKIIKLVA